MSPWRQAALHGFVIVLAVLVGWALLQSVIATVQR
jgi:hypothetical protein